MALATFRRVATMRDRNLGPRNMPTKRTLARLRVMAAAAAVLLLCVRANAAAPQPEPPHDGAHDFDFLIGDWQVHLRRLPDRLRGPPTWTEEPRHRPPQQ